MLACSEGWRKAFDMLRWLVSLIWPQIAARLKSRHRTRTASAWSPEPLRAVDDDWWWCTTEAGRLFGSEQGSEGRLGVGDVQGVADNKL